MLMFFANMVPISITKHKMTFLGIFDFENFGTSKISGHQECNNYFSLFFIQSLVGPKKISFSQGIPKQRNLRWWILDISWKPENSKK